MIWAVHPIDPTAGKDRRRGLFPWPQNWPGFLGRTTIRLGHGTATMRRQAAAPPAGHHAPAAAARPAVGRGHCGFDRQLGSREGYRAGRRLRPPARPPSSARASGSRRAAGPPQAVRWATAEDENGGGGRHAEPPRQPLGRAPPGRDAQPQLACVAHSPPRSRGERSSPAAGAAQSRREEQASGRRSRQASGRPPPQRETAERQRER